MKVAIFSDFHAGVRKFNRFFVDRQTEFIDDFIKDCEEKDIDTIFFLGDFIDNRRYIDFVVLYDVVDYFFNRIENSHIIKKIICIVGNHDMYHGNDYKHNIMSYIEEKFKKAVVVDDIKKKTIEDNSMLFVPFLHKNNFDKFSKYMKDEYDYCFGHFNVSDFYGHLKNTKKLKKIQNTDSLRITRFKNIKKKVFSGHIHLRAENKNFIYVGSPLQYSFEQANKSQGYYILDLSDDSYEFIEYPRPIYYKIKFESLEDFKIFEKEKEKYYDTFLSVSFSQGLKEKEKSKILDRMNLISENFQSIDYIDESIVDEIAKELDLIDDDEYLKKIEDFLNDSNVVSILKDFMDVYYKDMEEDDKIKVIDKFKKIYDECLIERKN